MKTLDRITLIPGIMGGRPCLRGWRVTAVDMNLSLINAPRQFQT